LVLDNLLLMKILLLSWGNFCRWEWYLFIY